MGAKLGLSLLLSPFMMIGVVALDIMANGPEPYSSEKIIIIAILAAIFIGVGAIQLGDVLDRIANR